ncbi:MAG: GNAT family N-acetyltransferase, partial [Lachnospiraceae bacterium]
EESKFLEIKSLWKEIFYEDSELFHEYYFEHKMKENIAYIIEETTINAMMFLTPIQMCCINQKESFVIPSFYIVGVGTKKDYRKKGYMNKLLTKALKELGIEKIPFVYLMPANPDIYTPYGFRYIYDKQQFVLDSMNETFEIECLKEDTIDELLEFVNMWLIEHKKIHVKRDYNYYQRQLLESKAQNGRINIIRERKHNTIIGYYIDAKEEGKIYIQEAMCNIGWKEVGALREEKIEPSIMGRIISILDFFEILIKLKTSFTREQLSVITNAYFTEELVLFFQVKDEILTENSGQYKMKLVKEKKEFYYISTIEKINNTINEENNCIGIEKLGECMFKYLHIYLNEIV